MPRRASALVFDNSPGMKKQKGPVVVRRYAASYLSDIVYGNQPMTRELARVIRALRRDHGLSYPRLGFCLCESDPDWGGSLGLGKALTELAAIRLKDHDQSWV